MRDSGRIEFTNRKEQALLAWLALRGDHTASRESAAPLLWGDRRDRRAHAPLSQALYSIRRTLADAGCEVLLTHGGRIGLDPHQTHVGAVEFVALGARDDPGCLTVAARL